MRKIKFAFVILPLTGLLFFTLNASPPGAGIDPQSPQQLIRGFGMSLAWQANQVYGNKNVAAQFNSADQQTYLELLYNEPGNSLGGTVTYNGQNLVPLGLNVARYNIGGGDNPSHLNANGQNLHMAAPNGLGQWTYHHQMDGFLSNYNVPYDWTSLNATII